MIVEYSSFYTDITKQKNVMICGAAGSGKSVLINGIIYDLTTRNDNQYILIDLKRVELIKWKKTTNCIGYHQEVNTTISALKNVLCMIDKRYREMEKKRLTMYTGKHLYIIIDEFADLMTRAKKEVVPLIQRIMQIGRAARVHIVLASQSPLASIIPSEIKCNFDSIIGLHTINKQQSRNIIDVSGLESLPMFGYCYYIKPGFHDYVRIDMIPEKQLNDLAKKKRRLF